MSKTNIDRARLGYTLIFWALVIQLVLGLALDVTLKYLYEHRAQDLGYDTVKLIVDGIILGWASAWILTLSASIAGLGCLISTSVAGQSRIWFTVALVSLFPALVSRSLNMLVRLEAYAPSLSLLDWAGRIGMIGMIVFVFALVVGLSCRARESEAPFATGLGIAAVVFAVLSWGLPTLIDWSEWLQSIAYREYNKEYRAFDQVVTIGSLALLLAVIPRGRASGNAATGSADDWDRGARGLDLFASAMLARVWIALAAAAALMVVFLAKSPDMLKMFVVLIPIATTIATAVMVAGTFEFGSLPWPPAAASAARAATVLFGVLLGLELWDLYQIYELFSGSPRPSDVQDPTATGFATQGLFMFGIILVIGAMARVGRAFVEDSMLPDGSGHITMVAVVFVASSLLQLPTILRKLVESPEGALFWMLLAALAVLAVLVSCARFARQVSAVMRTHAQSAPPTARVVTSD